jgi:lipopolysaccharide/colanic/teichoic acid biosynthesis glycosyltransferase
MAAKATARTDGRWLAESRATASPELCSQERFLRTLYLEQKRIERSNRRLVLMLAEPTHDVTSEASAAFFKRLVPVLLPAIRETDVIGWYEEGRVIGVIFTEVDLEEVQSVKSTLQARFTDELISGGESNPVKLQFHIFPDDWNKLRNGSRGPAASQRDAVRGVVLTNDKTTPATLLKRAIDITGSGIALIVGAPVLGAIAIAIKLTSPGPVLFKQKRVGQYGREFTFLKFRSMKPANDPSIHEEYAKAFISGEAGACTKSDGKDAVYKLTADPRITPIGRFLRRTSLDELPQFYNVLKGDMSLVGPRPPIPYEVSRYQLWHKRRFLSVKPGLTGLWQVTGRSRTTFDEMVRLDLQYAKSWSVWLDIKILLQTPFAVLKGDGAC